MGIERAEASDLPAIEQLLSTAGLPLEGAARAFETGVVPRDQAAAAVGASVELRIACADTAVAMRREIT